jgi:pimeloyl-ACP methyl ester carboxylesterase
MLWRRISLALDAAHNVQRRYKIDSERLFITGFSGGGRVACHLALAYPDVFRGGIYICGTSFYKPVPSEKSGEVWPANMGVPPQELLTLARTRRHVLLTGDGDFNREGTQMHYKHGFQADGFEHAHYVELKGFGHDVPDAGQLRSLLDLLEPPSK